MKCVHIYKDICMYKMRQCNSFINWADIQIHTAKLQMLCDKVLGTACFLGRLAAVLMVVPLPS